MNCPKCGVENPSDAVFCSACGERIDGKKHCIKCGKLIDEKNVYCNYCGTRQDGKTVCPKCKTAYEGSFCPNCGVKSSVAPVAVAVKSAPTDQPTARPSGNPAVKKALSVTQNSLIFSAIVLMFVFSFLIGMGYSVKADGVMIRESENAFNYLISPWKELSSSIQALEAKQDVYFELKFALYAPAIAIAVAVGANIIVCITYGILATCVFCKNVGKKEFSLYKYLIPPIISTLLSITILKAFYSSGDVDMIKNIYIGLNVSTIIEIILVALLLAAAIVFEFVLNGNKYAKNIFKVICLPIAALLLVIAAGVFSNKFIKIDGFSLSFILFINLYLPEVGVYPEVLPAKDLTLSVFSIAEFFVLVLGIVIILLTLFFMLRAFKKDKVNNILSLVFGIISMLYLISFLTIAIVMAGLTKSSSILGLQSTVSIGGSPIAGLILGIFALAAIIVYFAMSIAKKSSAYKTETQQN